MVTKPICQRRASAHPSVPTGSSHDWRRPTGIVGRGALAVSDASQAVDELLDTVGYVMGRYDVSGRTLGEEPAAVLAAVLADPPSSPSSRVLRDKVPDDERPLFDSLLAEARFGFSAHDDHAVTGGLWSLGIVRRGMLEAGRRLGFEPPELAFQLSFSEVAGGLRHDAADLGPMAAAHARGPGRRCSSNPHLPALGEGGFGGGPPPGLEMPGALGRLLSVLGAYMEAMSGTASPLRIGNGIARGGPRCHRHRRRDRPHRARRHPRDHNHDAGIWSRDAAARRRGHHVGRSTGATRRSSPASSASPRW